MSNKDTIQFLIGNESSSGRISDMRDYSKNLISYNITYDLFQGSASFSADLDTRVEVFLASKPLKFLWKINGILMMVGYIDGKELTYSKGSIRQSVKGRDMMQVLLDNFVLTPKTYDNKSLQDIINDVYNTSRSLSKLQYLSGDKLVIETLQTPISIPVISFIYTTEAKNILKRLPKFKSIKSTYGQTLFEFISQLCNSVGLYMFNLPGTSQIAIHAITTQTVSRKTSFVSYNRDAVITKEAPYKFYNKTQNANNNIISCNFSENIQDYHKYIRLIGQAQEDSSIAGSYYKFYGNSSGALKIEYIDGLDENNPDTPVRTSLVKGFTGVTKFKVANVNEVDLNIWTSTRDLLLNNLVLQQNRQLYTIKYTVADHSPIDTLEPYFINHVVQVYDDYLNIQGAEFLTYGITYRGSKDGGIITDLTLCLPSTSVFGVIGGSSK